MAIKDHLSKPEKQEGKQEKKSEAVPSVKPTASSPPQGPQDPGSGGSPAEPGEPIAKNPKVASVASWIVWVVAILIGVVFFWKTVGGKDSQVAIEPPAPVFHQPVQEVVSTRKAEVVRGAPKKDTFVIHLLGDDRWSEEAFDTKLAPPGVACYYEGPETAMVRLGDGTTGPITGWYGVKGGKTRFKGPAGEVVTVRCGDHDEESAEREEQSDGQGRSYPQQDPREVFLR